MKRGLGLSAGFVYLEDLEAVDVEDTDVEFLLVLLDGPVDTLQQTEAINHCTTKTDIKGENVPAGTDVDQEVEEAGVERFGQSISGETGLLRVQGDGDGLGLPSPLTVHDPAGELTAETVLRDPEQEGREGED